MDQTKGPPAGFGETVNRYLNDYVKVADAKAAAFLAANLGAATLVLRLEPPAASAAQWLRWLSLMSFVVSIGFCAWVVFPRLPKGRMGVIFWQDIGLYKSPTLYEQELRTMDEAAVESEYSAQNWFVSAVLHRKFVAVQWAIVSFFIAIGFATLAYLWLP